MYITAIQGDKLRNIVMGFEVPFRSFIAVKIINEVGGEELFRREINRKYQQLRMIDGQLVKSKVGQWANNCGHIFQLLVNAKKSFELGKIHREDSVPDVADLIVLTYVFYNVFPEISQIYNDYNVYWKFAEKYRYIRNKLDHPGSANIEESDMYSTVVFVHEMCLMLNDYHINLFWDKKKEDIESEIFSIQASKKTQPIAVINLHEMPFSGKKIVCRDNEIVKLKEFVYGKPGALRKKSSYCIFGYGGVGKTALVLELVKSIIGDIENGSTINGYHPDFILFFSAKEQKLTVSQTTGRIENGAVRKTFNSLETLNARIFEFLSIETFVGFEKTGLIIIDNLETLDSDERDRVKEFVRDRSPQNVQYIITSRNEESYDERQKVEGFENSAGVEFINHYCDENDLNIALSDDEKNKILQLSKGNTLVLVLSLLRLSQKMATIDGITAELSRQATVQKLEKEFDKLAYNGFEIISEFMFKNTFDEIIKVFEQSSEIMYSILKIFAIKPDDQIDIYTIALLTEADYNTIKPIVSMLYRYLIIERKGDAYFLNQFASQYIIQKLLPPSDENIYLSNKIEESIRDINSELKKFESDKKSNANVQNIVNDWCVSAVGDKIGVARVYKVFQDVNRDCNKGSSFFVESALEDAIKNTNAIEKMTMHPYIKFQKALILKKIEDSKVLKRDFSSQIMDSFINVIWTIKTNPMYAPIKLTKSYATVLWFYGQYMIKDKIKIKEVVKNLEEGCAVFEEIKNKDKEYYQCMSMLGNAYVSLYKNDVINNYRYLIKAKEISDKLFLEKQNYLEYKTVKIHATNLRSEVVRLYKVHT